MSGNFTNQMYDNCEFQRRTLESKGPLDYQLDRTKFVNLSRCQVYQPNYVSLIDTESEIKGINRFASKCSNFKYTPSCQFYPGQKNVCLSTFVPVSLPPEVCPDVEQYLYFNNGLLRPMEIVGNRFPNKRIC